MLVESANQFSLEELCRIQYSLKYFFSKPCRPSDLWQNLNVGNSRGIKLQLVILLYGALRVRQLNITRVCFDLIMDHKGLEDYSTNRPPAITSRH